METTSEGRSDSHLLLATYFILPLVVIYGLILHARNDPTFIEASTIRGPATTLAVNTHRERTLSICSTAGPEQPPATGHVTSSFFRLPAELRNRVYEAYISYAEICVYRDGKRLRAFGRRGQGYRAVGNWPVDMLPLLLTCRQVYTEAVPLLYSTPMFCFPWPTDFLSFAACVLPHRFVLLSKVGMSMGLCGRCSWPPNPMGVTRCTCNELSEDAQRGYLDYRFLALDAGVRNQLPSEHDGPQSVFGISCRLMSTLSRLESLKLVIPDAPYLDPDQSELNYDSFFHALKVLKREGLDVRILLEGKNIGMKVEWRSKLQEIVWQWQDDDGSFVIKKKSDAKQTWWEEWSKMRDDVREFQKWGMLPDYSDL